MKVGYARISTRDQDLSLQKAALDEAGCRRIYEEHTSTRDEKRGALTGALDYCREGDVLVVWKLDRLARSLKDLIHQVEELEERGVGLMSITESLDTTTPGGKLVFHVFGALAEFEREVIRERTTAGLAAARARGRSGGRPRKMDDQKVALARELLSNPERTVGEVCEILGVGRTTLYRALGPGGTGPSRYAQDGGGISSTQDKQVQETEAGEI